MAELGLPNSQEELEAVFQQLYGSARVAAGGGKRLFAESADQLELEAAAAARPLSPDGALLPPPPAASRQQAAAAAPASKAVQQQQAAVERALQPSAKQNMDALSARLSGRMGGGSGEVQLGFDASVIADGAGGTATAAVRKRVAPEPVGAAPARPASAELMPPPPPPPSGGAQDASKRVRLEAVPAAAAGSSRVAAQPAAAAAAASGRAVVAAGVGAPVAALPHIVLRSPDVPAEVTADLGCPPRLFEDAAAPPTEEHRRTLRITNREMGGGAGGRVQAEVACLEGRAPAPLWSDSLRGAAVAACGTHNFAAVGLADGQLMVSGLGPEGPEGSLHGWCAGLRRGAGTWRPPMDALAHLGAPAPAALLACGAPPDRAPQAGRGHRQAGVRRGVAPAGAHHQRRSAAV